VGFLEDLFGRLSPQRPPVDVFGGVQPLDAFGDLMGDGSDALQPITPFGGLDRAFGGFSGGLGSTTSSSPAFWQMPALGGGIGTTRQGAFSSRPTYLKETPALPRKRAFSTTPATTTTDTTGASSGTTATPTFSGTALPGTRDTVLRWMPLVQEMSAKYGVPSEVILASIDSESGGDPNAQSPSIPGVGHAWGLLQAVDKYWGHLGNLKDPRSNLDIVVGQLMKPAWDKYHQASHVRAVTYGGPGAIDSNGNIKGQLEDAGIPGWTIAKDVARYLPKVEAYKRYLQGQQQQPQAPPPQAAGGAADLADLWAWLSGNRAPVTGRFGEQDGPYPGTGHRGMDIGVPTGTRLTSPVEGVVMAAGDVGGGYGNQVRIKTAYGSVLLGHLSSVNVQPGQQVTPGMMLGVTGSTGKSTGPHLHFELRDQQDNPIDPARYYRW
jgi:murein DD-endopeptidase MepM/ murein hydrolase activator NlpD